MGCVEETFQHVPTLETVFMASHNTQPSCVHMRPTANFTVQIKWLILSLLQMGKLCDKASRDEPQVALGSSVVLPVYKEGFFIPHLYHTVFLWSGVSNCARYSSVSGLE